MRFWDSTAGNYGYVPGRSEADTLLTQGRNFAIPFWGLEMILGGVVAAVLLIIARVRQSATLLMLGCGLAMAGIVANRWNTTMLAFTLPLSTEPYLTVPSVVRYTPNLVEWATSLGIVAGLTLAFSLGAKFLPAFRGVEVPEAAPVTAPERVPSPVPAGGD
jgi:molybdopterin-containing oxidoreductase family membrane subunit